MNMETTANTFEDDVKFWVKMFAPRAKKYLREVRARNNAPSANRSEYDWNKIHAQNEAIKRLLN
jgi:hypothetical protein